MVAVTMFLFAMLFLGLPAQSAVARETLTFSTIDDAVEMKVCEAVVREAYHRIGIDIAVTPLPTVRAIETANSGKIDGELCRIKEFATVYLHLRMVPVPVKFSEIVAFSKSVNFLVKGWESLRPYKIGIKQGFKYSEIGTKGMNVEVAASSKSLFEMLEAGHVDIVVIAKANGLEIVKNNDLKGIHVLNPPVDVLPFYNFIHEKNENLLPKITGSLLAMKKEGRIAAIGAEIRAHIQGGQD